MLSFDGDPMTQHAHARLIVYKQAQRALLIAFSVIVTIMVVEVVGGVLSNSLALVSDAGHMFMDALALGMSFIALRVANRPATARKTYGHYRWEVLTALANGILLILVAFYIFYEAYLRLTGIPNVRGLLMLAVATIGLAANLAAVYVLRDVRKYNLNVRGAFMHVLSDTISSVGVIATALIISLTGIVIVDSFMGLLIGGIILSGAIWLVQDSGRILLEAVPEGIDADNVVRDIKKVKGVRSVHDFHIWTISSGLNAMSGHIVIEDQMVSRAGEILKQVAKVLRDKYSVLHTTIQLECKTCKGPFVCSPVTKEKH